MLFGLTEERTLPDRVERPEQRFDEPLNWFWRADAIVGQECAIGYTRFRIIKRTPRGVWLQDEWDWDARYWCKEKSLRKRPGARFVKVSDRHVTIGKAHAYPTRELALESLIRRTRRRVGYARTALENAERIQATLKHHFPERH